MILFTLRMHEPFQSTKIWKQEEEEGFYKVSHLCRQCVQFMGCFAWGHCCLPWGPLTPWGGPWGCTQLPHACQHIAADSLQEGMHGHCKSAHTHLSVSERQIISCKHRLSSRAHSVILHRLFEWEVARSGHSMRLGVCVVEFACVMTRAGSQICPVLRL